MPDVISHPSQERSAVPMGSDVKIMASEFDFLDPNPDSTQVPSDRFPPTSYLLSTK